jgi:hypothetical protein
MRTTTLTTAGPGTYLVSAAIDEVAPGRGARARLLIDGREVGNWSIEPNRYAQGPIRFEHLFMADDPDLEVRILADGPVRAMLRSVDDAHSFAIPAKVKVPPVPLERLP